MVNALKKEGWYIDRTHGSHVIMRNEEKTGIKIVVPIHAKSVKPGTLNNIVKKAELSIERLKEIL